MFLTGTAPIDLGPPYPYPEMDKYYSKLFEGKVTIVPSGSNPWDALDQFGKIIFEKDGIVKEVRTSDLMLSQGFNGIYELVQRVKNQWSLDPDEEPEYATRKLYWRAYFGV